MTNAPKGRKTHVVRLVGTNKDGDVLQNVWVDVERIDQLTIRTQTSLPQFNIENQYQEVGIKLKWRDDPQNADTYIAEDDLSADAGTGRKHEIVKVCSPDEDDLKNPSEWVAVKTIVHIDMDQQGIGTSQKRFIAEAVDAKARKVSKRRMYHYDTNIDDDAQSAFDDDETLKAYVVAGKDYTRDNSTNTHMTTAPRTTASMSNMKLSNIWKNTSTRKRSRLAAPIREFNSGRRTST